MSPPSTPAVGPPASGPTEETATRPAESTPWTAALVCFGFSGASALLFQTAWTQQLGLIFGASELAVISVLAAFMAGLALGSSLGGRWASRARQPLLAYGVVEALIATYALALPLLLRSAARVQRLLFASDGFDLDAGLGARTAFQLIGATLLLLPPTMLMGASLPLLVRSTVHRQSLLGFRVGVLYALNTFGAALGALITGFVLLPRLGLGRVLYVGVGLNLAVALLAVSAALRAKRTERSRVGEDLSDGTIDSAVPATDRVGPENPERPARDPRWPLWIAALTGALALALEVLWTRLLTFALGGSIYSLATMLATFLLAIACGTVLASRFAGSPGQATRAIAVFLLFAGITLPPALAAADRLPSLLEALAGPGDSLLISILLGAGLMFPGALAFGACFPLAVRAASRDARSAAAATGRVLAANTAGAVAGVVTTGLYLLPGLGFDGLTRAVSALALGAAGVLALALRPRIPWVAGGAAVAMAVTLIAPPSTPWNLLRMSPTAVLTGRPGSEASTQPAEGGPRFSAFGPVVFAGVGRSATVLLHREGLEWRLTSNGLPESAVQPPGGRVARYAIARWLTLLPTALRPEIERLLVIGLGAGHSVENLPPSIGAVEVVELEPEILRANRAMASARRSDPLADPRVHVRLGDGRSALALHRELFDAIVSQPSHPWTAGSASLFTQEFFALVRDRLKPGGVFVQWIGLDFVDVPLLRSLVATLQSAFPFVECYRPNPGGAMLFVASDRALTDLASARHAIARDAGAWAELGVLSVEDLVLAKVLDQEGARRFADGAETTSDLRNLLQTRSPRILAQPRAPAQLEEALSPIDALRDLPRELDGAYVVRRLLDQGAPVRALRVATGIHDTEQRRSAFAWLDLRGFGRIEATGESVSPEALATHLLRRRATGERAEPAEELASWIGHDAAAGALVDAWQRLDEWQPEGWPEIDARLAAVDPHHPLSDAAIWARIAGELRSNDPELATAAVKLIDRLLARRVTPNELLLRGSGGVVAGDRWIALAALDELARILPGEGPERSRNLVQARQLLHQLAAMDPPAEDREEHALEVLESMFAGLGSTPAEVPAAGP